MPAGIKAAVDQSAPPVDQSAPAGIKAAVDQSAPRGAKSGVDFHGLRHDFASLLGDLGVPQHVSMRMVGHSQASMTAYYQHAGEAAQREAAGLVDGWLRQTAGG